MDNVLLGITVALAILDWYAADRNLPIEKFTKPGVLIFLLAWFSSQGGWSGANLPFAMGLVFSLAGDTFLLWENRFFMPGLVSFLLAHICYIIGFNLSLPPFNLWTVVLIAVVAVIWLRGYTTIRRQMNRDPANAAMRLPVTVYTLVISLMVLSAVLCLTKPDWRFNAALLASLGGGMFFLSDFILANEHFGRPFYKSHTIVMVTYHIAQIAIIASVVMHKI